MPTVFIVDDEPKLREVLKLKLEKYCPNTVLLGEAGDVTEAENGILKTKPDIVLLDISMPGASGFDLLNKFESITFEVIFVTGFDEYGLNALKVSAVDYLLKPIKTSELVAAIDKACKLIEDRQKLSKYDILKHNILNQDNQSTKVAIPGSDAYDFITVSEIIHCEGWNKYTKIHLESEEVIVSSYNIGVFRNMLEPYGFFSCHKSHIINRHHIKRYLKEGLIILSNSKQVPLARRRKDEFVEKILSSLISLD